MMTILSANRAEFMTDKFTKTIVGLPKDIAIDYALIATGIAAGTIGLLYFFLS